MGTSLGKEARLPRMGWFAPSGLSKEN
jgi:hypothetical protein